MKNTNGMNQPGCVLFPSTCINMLGNPLSCEISKLGHPLVLLGSKKRLFLGQGQARREQQRWSYCVWKVAFVVTGLVTKKKKIVNSAAVNIFRSSSLSLRF